MTTTCAATADAERECEEGVGFKDFEDNNKPILCFNLSVCPLIQHLFPCIECTPGGEQDHDQCLYPTT